MPLKVAIVGAGIAGLCGAVGLRRAGHEVEIFEKSAFTAETGAALVISPNGARVLSRLGFSFTNARAVRLDRWTVFRGDSMQMMANADMSVAKERFGAEAWAIHRVDLHDELLRLARSPTEPGQAIKLHLSSEVVDASADGKIVLKDSSTHTADLVVAADGLKSALRGLVTQDPAPPASTALSAFRFLIDTQKLKADGKLVAILEEMGAGASLLADTKETTKERHMMWYACRNGKVQNFVGIHPTREDEIGDDPEAVRAVMLDEFRHFCPEILETVRQSSAVKCWPLFAHHPLPTWCNGRIVLIGDSAHPMLPFGGQGANSAIEDGGSLGYIFHNHDDVSTVPDRLKLFYRARYARAARVQILSSVRVSKEKDVEEQLLGYSDPPGSKVPANMIERMAHDYGFDAFEKCKEVMGSPNVQGDELWT